MKVMVGQLEEKDFEREIRGIYFRLKNRAVGLVLVLLAERRFLFTVYTFTTKEVQEFCLMKKPKNLTR